MKVMIVFPNAKINLGLNVVSKRDDGYHNIETIFYPIQVKDALELVVSLNDETNIKMSGIPVDGDASSNLVIKAYELLVSRYSLPNLSICLQKNIPLGAGLGGGSADAAFMLKMLDSYFELNVSIDKLEELAGMLGSDCPFFIKNKPVFASGRGEVFEEIELDLSSYYIVLVKPDVHVSTKDAYFGCIPSAPKYSLKEIVKKPIEDWKSLMVNDFELSVFVKYPEISKIKDRLYGEGAIYASMSGSGSSVFGIYREPIDLQNTLMDVITGVVIYKVF